MTQHPNQTLAVDFEAFCSAGHLARTDLLLAQGIAEMLPSAADVTTLAVALAIASTRGGSVCVDLTTVESLAVEVGPSGSIDWPNEDFWQSVIAEDLARCGEPCPVVLDGSRLYLERYWRREVHLADQIRARSSAATALPLELEDELLRLFPGDSASSGGGDADGDEDRQLQAARLAASRQLTVIAGGPGTGKTTTISRIYALLVQMRTPDGSRPLVAMAAPTGRAAARLKESLAEHAESIGAADDVRELMRRAQPMTLHRLLGFQPQNQSRFRHDARNPLPFDAVIVDECSMISLTMMDQLFDAIVPATRIVLVGDPQQLASVDAGSAFGDLVAAAEDENVDRGVVVLDRVHRFGEDIATLATNILAGDVDAVAHQLRAGDSESLSWVAQSPIELTADQRGELLGPVTQLWRHLADAAGHGHSREAANLIDGARILCGHRFGPHGVSDWNRHAYAAVFGNSGRWSDCDGWFAGRPVLVQDNDYQLEVFNGDTGVVVEKADGSQTVIFDRSKDLVEVVPNRLGPVQTAFASTVHKSQGSQFRNVVVVLPPPESRLMTRELLYTAVTRAQSRITIVGTMESLAAAVRTGSVRQSGLRDRLTGRKR